MDTSVVYVEQELAEAYHKVWSYADFLYRQMEEFDRILKDIQETAINDNLICAELSNLSSEVKPFANEVYRGVNETLQGVVWGALADVDTADNFRYPDYMLDGISALLARYL